MIKLYADTHVHIYLFYSLSSLLDSALANFLIASRGVDTKLFLLCLTERSDCHFFRDAVEGKARIDGDWEILHDTALDVLQAKSSRGTILILPGRQNISSERLEVLSLGSDNFIVEGIPAEELIHRSESEGLLTILPWSLGKWTGKRGNEVQRLLQDSPLNFHVGDPSHRIGPIPRFYHFAESTSRRLYRGSDPLPIPGEEGRAAEYGTIFNVKDIPQDKKALLDALRESSGHFGGVGGVLRNISLQVKLRRNSRPK